MGSQRGALQPSRAKNGPEIFSCIFSMKRGREKESPCCGIAFKGGETDARLTAQGIVGKVNMPGGDVWLWFAVQVLLDREPQNVGQRGQKGRETCALPSGPCELHINNK